MPQLSPSGVAVRVRDAHRSDRRAVRAVLLAAYREYAAVLPPAVFGPYLADVLDLDARDGGPGGLKERSAGGVRGTPGGFPVDQGPGAPAPRSFPRAGCWWPSTPGGSRAR
jgi:hypothetical protein